MGLTIHYILKLDGGASDNDVRRLLARARAYALELDAAKVSPLIRLPQDLWWAHSFARVKESSEDEDAYVSVEHLAGYGFTLYPGADCEPANIGLCRYPATIRHAGAVMATGLGSGWSMHGCCKTQYASLHGWDHFFKCHEAVVLMLRYCRSLGIKVKVGDEGGYWSRRSKATLRRKLGEVNALMAAVAGFLKDEGEKNSDIGSVQAPILQHPQFERLEHEGQSGATPHLDALRRAVRRERGRSGAGS